MVGPTFSNFIHIVNNYCITVSLSNTEMWTNVTGKKTDATVIHAAITCLEPTSATVPRGDTAGDIVMVRCRSRGSGVRKAHTRVLE